jgi:hypothetical protein
MLSWARRPFWLSQEVLALSRHSMAQRQKLCQTHDPPSSGTGAQQHHHVHASHSSGCNVVCRIAQEAARAYISGKQAKSLSHFSGTGPGAMLKIRPSCLIRQQHSDNTTYT